MGQFKEEVDSHQGSVLSPQLFICVTDVLTDGVRGICIRLIQADDAVLIGESVGEAVKAYEK